MSDSWIDDTLKSKTRDEAYTRFKQTVIDFYKMGFSRDETELGISVFLDEDGSIFSNICLYWLAGILDEVFGEEI